MQAIVQNRMQKCNILSLLHCVYDQCFSGFSTKLLDGGFYYKLIIVNYVARQEIFQC